MPIAFLSHSSQDKDIVGQVFEELGAASAHYDQATFEAGERSASEIYAALSRTDLFVLFASPASIESNWVQSELAVAQQKVFAGHIKKAIVFLLKDVSPERLPPWLKDHVYQRISSPKLIAKVVRSRLLDIALDAGSEFKPFVGRERELAALKATLARVSSAAPDIVFLSGVEGIGRRSLTKKALQETYPWLSQFPVEVSLTNHQGDIELYKELLSYARESTVDQILASVKDFSERIPLERAQRIAKLIGSIAAQKQLIFLKGHESIVKDNGDLQDWIANLISELGKRSHPQLIIVSRRMVTPGRRASYENVHFVALQSLSTEHTRDLFSLWLKQLGVEFPSVTVNEIADKVLGHPKNTEIAARYAAEVGVARMEADPREFLQLIQQRSEALLETIPLTEEQKSFIALFREYEYLSSDDILTAVDTTDTDVQGVLAYLQDHGVIESDGRYLRLAPYLSDAVSRFRTSSSTARAFVEQAQQRFIQRVETFTTNDYVSISTIDKAVLTALRTGRLMENSLISRALLPSQQLRVAREFYDEQNYERAAELCDRALKRSHLLTRDAQIEALRIRALALVRIGDSDQFYACLAELRTYDERVAKRAEQFLRGFKLRWDGRPDEAEPYFRKAFQLGGDRNFHVLRELAQVLAARGEFEEAERHARVALSIAPRNAYVVDNLLEILIDKDRDNLRSLAANKEIQRLFSILQEAGKLDHNSFYQARMAHFYSVLKNPEEALNWANRAASVTPNLASVRLIQIRALLSARKLQEAADKLAQLEKVLQNTGAGGDRRFGPEIEKLRVKVSIEQGKYERARSIVDHSPNLPEKLRQSLKRELAEAIVYASSQDPDLIKWANSQMKKL